MINSFSGEHRWLSNFWICPFEWQGYFADTSEHHFQAAKAQNSEDREWVYESLSPGQAKRRGKTVNYRPDWNDVRVEVMRDILRHKFAILEMREKLLATGDEELIEGNTWGDTFWGVCNRVGENWLGRILMEIREEAKNKT